MNKSDIEQLIRSLNETYHQKIPDTSFFDLNTEKEIRDRYEAYRKHIYLTKQEVEEYLKTLKETYRVKVYTPYKYFEGLKKKKEIQSRFLDIVKGRSTSASDPTSYRPFKTDQKRKSQTSRYTKMFEERYGKDAKSLLEKSERSGVPFDILEEVFRKGKAAWRTGHRVGANENQWGYARVHSFLTLGCTALGADFYLVKRAIQRMKKRDIQTWFSYPIFCPEETLKKDYYRKRGAVSFIDSHRRKSISTE